MLNSHEITVHIKGAVDSVCSRLFNLSNIGYALYFVQLRIAKVKQTTTNGIDSTFDMHSDFMTVQQDASMDYPFKIGYNNMQGWISYVNGNTVLSKRYVHDAKAVYPDNDASSQVYCSKDFLELTVQSPLYRIEPEDTVKHVENFSLFHTTITEKPNNNEAYQTFLETLA